MTAYKKNIMVAVTVLVALCLLGWMMWRFGGIPATLFTEGQIPVVFVAESAAGVSEGSSINYRGLSVGRVVSVRLSDDSQTVIINAMIDKSPPLPANIEGVIRAQAIGGSTWIELELVDSGSGQALRPDARLHARAAPDLTRELEQASRELRRILARVSDADLVGKLAGILDHVDRGVAQAGKVLESIQQVVGDEKLRQNIYATAENFRDVSATAKRIAGNLETTSQRLGTRVDEVAGNANQLMATAQKRLDDISKSLGDRLIQVANVLDSFETASKKLNDNKGTAGRLLNDPALYQNLLDASTELKGTMADLRRLIEQWEQEGVYMKLGNKK